MWWLSGNGKTLILDSKPFHFPTFLTKFVAWFAKIRDRFIKVREADLVLVLCCLVMY